MQTAHLLVLPFSVLVALVLAGSGPASLLGASLPADARAALTPLLGVAVFACVSVLAYRHVPAAILGVSTLGLLAALALAVRRRVRETLRAGAGPMLVAGTGLMLAAAPSLARGSWVVSSLGNADVYLWTSQARALLHGPVAGPVATHPDALAFHRVSEQGWAIAYPFGNALVASAAGREPWEVYGALAAVLAACVPLAGYFAARACLEWTPQMSTLAGLVLAANSYLLFVGFNGWQLQLVGTALVVAAAATFRLALEPGAPRRLAALAGLLTAAALASYRLPFAPYLSLRLAVVFAGVIVWSLFRKGSRAGLGRTALWTAAWTTVFGAPSLVAIASHLPSFLSNQLDEVAWRAYPHSTVAGSLGLLPPRFTHVVELSDQVVAARLVVALALVGIGLWVALRTRQPRVDFLVSGAVFALVGGAILLLPPFSPYLSIKFLGYAAPLLTLVALTPLARLRSRTTTACAAAALLVVAASGAATVSFGVEHSATPGALTGLAEVVDRIPAGATVDVEPLDAWSQLWAVYYLRERKLSVERPSIYLDGIGLEIDAHSYSHEHADFVLGPGTRPDALWVGAGLSLAPVPDETLLAARRSP